MKRHLPPLNALRAFEAAARLGRMTRAADELAVTPGAISRQVRQLELHLGVRLFEGPKNQPHLSSAAHTLLPVLRAAFDQIEAAVRTVSQTQHGTLDVSCFSTFAVKWLIPRIYGFNALYPDINVRLSTAGRDLDLAADAQATHCDVMITAVPNGPPSAGETGASFEVLDLFPERLGPVLAPALAQRGALRHAQDLLGQPRLQTRTRLNAWQMWADARHSVRN
jgi:DNA-binding transcriptional LysR family regulator